MSPPLTPSADEARRLLADELSKPIYLDARNWLMEQLRKLLDWLQGSSDPTVSTSPLSGGQGLWIGFGTAAVLVVVIWALMGPLRAERRRSRELFDEEELSAADLRAKASALAANGEWGQAIVEHFRAMIRSLSERVIIEEFAGMTADEASTLAAVRLPSLAEQLAQAARDFDAVAYGDQPGTAEQYQQLVDLDAEVAAATPVLPQRESQAAVSVEVGQ
ncbi:uncharacterized protein DUF4129 [Propionicimonas paludicola]|uniref:Uncharacterized protein DUF4129 n=1 Tax=Propionicimonas paludicola TaxID=185243 RepID=A0A2A9CT83_9ACTN|nr:DUF4129 domain-containing protein [Propionicimonas paludicola]PFG17663.1 uncharacterized protein DUF4129 [Propionicimonas paludicola]